MQLYPVTRSLDYTVNQAFVVLADSIEDAEERTTLFCESDWSNESAERLGVVQVGDEMEQIENSEDIRVGTSIEGTTTAVDSSLRLLALQGKAETMFSLLKDASALGALNNSGLAESIKTLIDELERDFAKSQSMLLSLVDKAQ